MATLQVPVHPGETLKDEFLAPPRGKRGQAGCAYPSAAHPRRTTDQGRDLHDYRPTTINDLGHRKGKGAQATNETLHGTSGTSGTRTARSEPRPESSSHGSLIAMPRARIGGRWRGGYMTTCLIPRCASIRASAPSTLHGMNCRSESFAATLRPRES